MWCRWPRAILKDLDLVEEVPVGGTEQKRLIYEFLRNVLIENGMNLESARVRVLALFLVKNDFTKLAQLTLAEHPSQWVGADELMEYAITFVWGLRNSARKRSRYVSCSHGVVSDVHFVWQGRDRGKGGYVSPVA